MTDDLRGPRRCFFTRAGRLAALSLLAGRLGPVDAALRRDSLIEGLIQRMTLEEKAGQLSIYFDDAREEAPHVNPAQVAKAFDSVQNDILQGRSGGLFNGLGVASGRRLQRLAVEQSRLKIPLIFAADVIHGLRTVFPVPLGEAAAFDPDLAERTARASAVEATAVGIQWTFGPVVDVARDQRWGRVGEGAGEDPYLGRLLAAARVRGFQGRSFPALVREGTVPLAALDEAVRRVLGVKQALRLFDNPYRSLDLEKERTQIRLPQTVALAREAARRAVVLLKNDGGLLPLQRAGTSIALIGPFAADRAHVMGPWALWAEGRRDGLTRGHRPAARRARCTGHHGELVPGQRNRARHRRLGLWRSQPFGPVAGELSVGFRPAA